MKYAAYIFSYSEKIGGHICIIIKILEKIFE